MHLVHAVHATRTLWQNDNVLMGAWFGLRADWYADCLDDMRSIIKYIDMEQDLITKKKRHTMMKQRDGMHKAWDRINDTVDRVSNAHAKDA